MSYTFSASGLPPGLSLVGSDILGTPSTPGNYTATFTVSDGVSSVSNVVSITIAPAAVPVPFWRIILEAESGSYAGESVSIQTIALAEAGNYWGDSVFVVLIEIAESGVYWGNDAVVDTSTRLLSAPYQECYRSGKTNVCFERGTYTWRANTTPVNTGSQVTFVQCNGSIITLDATAGGTLSTSGSTTDIGACP